MFGLSIGDTDKDWWNFIANSIIKRNSKLIIFAHSEKEIDGLFGFDKEEVSDNIINNFISKLTIDTENIDKLKENIFVSINSKIFKIKLIKKTIEEELHLEYNIEPIKKAFAKS